MSLVTDVKISAEELEVLGIKILEAFPEGLTTVTLFQAVSDSMVMVGQIKNMRGVDKKQLVIDMLHYILDKTDSGYLEAIEPFIKKSIPQVIDTLIDVEKGNLRFNPKMKKRMMSCFSC
jgi:hypothetical protein